LPDEELEEPEEGEDDDPDETPEYDEDAEGWRQDSEEYRALIQDPNVRLAILASENGIDLTRVSLDGLVDQPEQPKKEVDPNDPVAVLRSIVEEVVGKALDDRVPRIAGDMQESILPLINEQNQRLIQSEYDSLVAESPAVKSLGLTRILGTMQKHPTLTMREAANITEPRISRASPKPAPRVQSSSARAGSTGLPAETSRIRQLQDRAREEMKNPVGIREKITNTFSKKR